MIVNSLPIWIIDMVGSILMIIFSFLCLNLIGALRNRDKSNVIWTYLFWVCLGLAGFAVSRSAGHILKQILVLSGNENLWSFIRPYSGAINSLMFVFVASVTLFFERIWKIYQQISKDKQALQGVRDELLFLNQNLESLVAERTKELALSEHNYRRIFEVSRDMILVTRPDGTIINMNPAGYDILGLEKDDDSPSRKNFADFFVHAAEWQAVKRALERYAFVPMPRSALNTRRIIRSGFWSAPAGMWASLIKRIPSNFLSEISSNGVRSKSKSPRLISWRPSGSFRPELPMRSTIPWG